MPLPLSLTRVRLRQGIVRGAAVRLPNRRGYMRSRMKPTATVYPCRLRSEPSGSDSKAALRMWITWEAIEREHFSPLGSLIADFSRPLEVDPSLVRNHRYVPDS